VICTIGWNSTSRATARVVTAVGRFFWLKLPTNFFFSDDVKVILSQQGGERYTLFWIKLLLKALEQEEIGVLRYKSDVPYTPEVLAAVTETDPDVVRSALTLFANLGMITTDEEGSIIIESVHGYVGSATDSAIRMRKLRQRNKKQLEEPEKEEVSHCDAGLSQCDDLPSQNEQSDVEIETEIEVEGEREREKDIDLSSTQPPDAVKAAPAELSKEQREVSDIMAGRI
jgi:predicted phage replisome organizer